jgi:hypothetical protein
MPTNLQRLADYMVPLSEDRFREVLRQGEMQASSKEGEYVAEESDDSEEYLASAAVWLAAQRRQVFLSIDTPPVGDANDRLT